MCKPPTYFWRNMLLSNIELHFYMRFFSLTPTQHISVRFLAKNGANLTKCPLKMIPAWLGRQRIDTSEKEGKVIMAELLPLKMYQLILKWIIPKTVFLLYKSLINPKRFLVLEWTGKLENVNIFIAYLIKLLLFHTA